MTGIEMRGVCREYSVGGRAVHALRDVHLAIADGDYVSIMGPSGSGKSTLLNIIGCLDRPTAGEYRLDGQPVGALDERALSRIRGHKIGFVFQVFHLVPRLTAAANVELRFGMYAIPSGPAASSPLWRNAIARRWRGAMRWRTSAAGPTIAHAL